MSVRLLCSRQFVLAPCKVETYYDMGKVPTNDDLVKRKIWHLCKLRSTGLFQTSLLHMLRSGSLMRWVCDQCSAGNGGPSFQQQRQQNHTLMVLLYVKDCASL